MKAKFQQIADRATREVRPPRSICTIVGCVEIKKPLGVLALCLGGRKGRNGIGVFVKDMLIGEMPGVE